MRHAVTRARRCSRSSIIQHRIVYTFFSAAADHETVCLCSCSGQPQTGRGCTASLPTQRRTVCLCWTVSRFSCCLLRVISGGSYCTPASLEGQTQIASGRCPCCDGSVLLCFVEGCRKSHDDGTTRSTAAVCQGGVSSSHLRRRKNRC